MGMWFAPTWLRQVSPLPPPLLHMPTLTTAVRLAVNDMSHKNGCLDPWRRSISEFGGLSPSAEVYKRSYLLTVKLRDLTHPSIIVSDLFALGLILCCFSHNVQSLSLVVDC